MKKFDISVVMPVYNCKKYLREAVDSVIGQSIGFDRIQLILVDDGSTDGCREICEEYAAAYPCNIEVIHKSNGGVSSARNAGIDRVRGPYVNFMDADDKWDEHAFRHLLGFLNKRGAGVDVAAAREHFFGARTGYNVLDYKFIPGTRVAEIDDPKELYSVQWMVNSAFIRTCAIGDIRFDEMLRFGEDAAFINRIILRKRAYGLVREAIYMYRKRPGTGAASDLQYRYPDCYLDTIHRYHEALEEYSRQLYGRVLPYIQSVVASDMGWRAGLDPGIVRSVLDEEGLRSYHGIRQKVLSDVDERIILDSPLYRSMYVKANLLYFRNGRRLLEEMRFLAEKNAFYDGDRAVLNLTGSNDASTVIDYFTIAADGLILEGRIPDWILRIQGFSLRFSCFGRENETEIVPYSHSREALYDEMVPTMDRFICRIPMDGPLPVGSVTVIRPLLVKDGRAYPVSAQAGKYMPDGDFFSPSFRFLSDIAFRVTPEGLVFRRAKFPFARRFLLEWKWCAHAVRERRFGPLKRRLVYHIRKLPLGRRKLWLFSDRPDNAGDNGEVLFRYARAHCPKGILPVFGIGRNAGCVQRLKGEGRVVFFENDAYAYAFLAADKVISSGASDITADPWKGWRKYLIDLYPAKYYYLQHGVACADLSEWLNRTNKNLHMIFTSSPEERRSFLSEEYGYAPEQVKLTGMTRFDELKNGDRKQILIMPTWRRSIRGSYDPVSTVSIYYDGFRETAFFRFYNGLINDERLLEAMRRKGYRGLFCLHPIMKEQWQDFIGNDVFTVNRGFVDYNRVFEDSSLMVTDYSSVLFDFAYLRKSVVYAQFDKKEFFEAQIYDQGYFDYERDGFGPVCCDYESTVDTLIRYVENDCVDPPEYVRRVDRFFAFSDRRNCERAFDVIVNDK